MAKELVRTAWVFVGASLFKVQVFEVLFICKMTGLLVMVLLRRKYQRGSLEMGHSR
jgi:hypothetical protein